MWRWRAVAFVGGGALLIASILTCAMVLSRLLDRQQTALVAASHDALTDPLTGLFNRRMFQDWATTEWSRARRQGTPLSLLVLDIDHFKRINDTFGHAAGDEVLIEITSCLRSLIRKEDLIARVGGEEFAIIMPNLSLADASGFAERLRAGVEAQPLLSGKSTMNVTISIGVAEAQHGPTPIETALSAADMALYRAKQRGRNRVVVAGRDGDRPPLKRPSFTVVEGKKAAPKKPA
jgi:diguanylate cyclase (GGDEF)-like protein